MIAQTRRAARDQTRLATETSDLVFIMPSFTVGGAQTQLATLLAARPELVQAFRVKIITLSLTQSLPLVERFDNLKVKREVVTRAGTTFPQFFWQLTNTLRRARPTIVHTMLHASTGTWGRLAARLVGAPYIFHSDLSLDPPTSRVQQFARPLLDRLTTRFTPNAIAIADKLAASGVPREKIRVVPNGVDLSRFVPTTASARIAWGIPAGATVAGFLGMLRSEKRPDLLLEAVLRLAPEHRPDFIVFAGDGPLMPALRERVEADPWLKAHCRLLGLVEDTPAFLAGIDYLVLPSDREGLPNAVLEAMAMEKPIVATRVSDVPRLVEGVGFLAEPKQAASLANAIAKMQALAPQARRSMGQRGRERVLANYEISSAADRFWNAHLEFLRAPQSDGFTP